MKRILLGTTALAFAGAMGAGQASAADMLSVGVGGFMQQWVGVADVDSTGADGKANDDYEGGVAQQSDSEIHFRGKLESDNGLTFSVKVELEGNGGGDIDESQVTIGGEFGKLTLGAEDPASTLAHHGGLDVGITLNCGDTHKWIGSGEGGFAGCSHNGFGTYGHGHGDKNQIMYFSPRMEGMQFGASYIPDKTQEAGNKALNDNETDAWAVGGNYVGEFGGTNIAFSLGHYQASQEPGANQKVEDKTFSNVGLNVGFGAFSFAVAYAENDGGISMMDGDGYMEDKSKNWDTVGAGVKYSDGPMAISLSHLATEWGDNGDQNATMLSMSYTLAPGVASKSSLFAAERSMADKSSVEGTAFVTGIVIGF